MPINFDINDLEKLNHYIKWNNGVISEELAKRIVDLCDDWVNYAFSIINCNWRNHKDEANDFPKQSFLSGVTAFFKWMSEKGIDDREKHCTTKTLLFRFCERHLTNDLKALTNKRQSEKLFEILPELKIPEVENFELKDIIEKTLYELNEGYRQLIIWRYIKGLEIREIADNLGISYNTAKNYLCDARTAFESIYLKIK